MAGETLQILNALRSLVQTLRVGSRASERTVGLSSAQLFVLEKLAESSPLSINELAESTHTHQSSVSVVVSKLVRQKLIHRSRSDDDARRLVLTITEAGRNKLQLAPQTVQERLLTAIGAMNAKDRRTLAALLDQLISTAGIAEVTPSLFFEDKKIKKTIAKR